MSLRGEGPSKRNAIKSAWAESATFGNELDAAGRSRFVLQGIRLVFPKPLIAYCSYPQAAVAGMVPEGSGEHGDRLPTGLGRERRAQIPCRCHGADSVEVLGPDDAFCPGMHKSHFLFIF